MIIKNAARTYAAWPRDASPRAGNATIGTSRPKSWRYKHLSRCPQIN
jgi:hypothetical protein